MRYLVVGLAMLLACSAARAGTSSKTQTMPASPEAAVQQYLDAASAGKWERMATLIHPDAIQKRFKSDWAKIENGQEHVLKKYGLDSREEFRELTADEAFERMRSAEKPADLLEAQRMAEMVVSILGAVVEGDLVHVVVRLEHAAFNNVAVMTCKKHDESWLINRL